SRFSLIERPAARCICKFFVYRGLGRQGGDRGSNNALILPLGLSAGVAADQVFAQPRPFFGRKLPCRRERAELLKLLMWVLSQRPNSRARAIVYYFTHLDRIFSGTTYFRSR